MKVLGLKPLICAFVENMSTVGTLPGSGESIVNDVGHQIVFVPAPFTGTRTYDKPV